MKLRDYYVVLGVERDERPEGIRRAFHELALRYHPDRAGEGATALFQDLVDAYRVLSDGRTRAAYDRALRHAERALAGAGEGAASRPTIAVPFSPRRDAPEPLAAWGFAGTRAAPLDAWFQRSQAEQAAVGGGLTLEVPVFFPCETCRGQGEWEGQACPACGGATVLPEPRPLTVPIPPGVQDGGELELHLRGLGLHSLYVRVRARVLGGGGPRVS